MSSDKSSGIVSAVNKGIIMPLGPSGFILVGP